MVHAPPTRARRSSSRLDRAAKVTARDEAIARAREALKAARVREGALAREVSRVDRAAREARKSLDSVENELRRMHADREAARRDVETARRVLEAARASRS